MDIQPLNFHGNTWSAFDEPVVDTENHEAIATTPDFVAMCDLLSDNADLNSIQIEDIYHG